MRNAYTFLTSTFICLFSSMPAFAQAAAEEEPEKSYVMSYFAVGLGIALGLVAVCRNSSRRKEVRKPG